MDSSFDPRLGPVIEKVLSQIRDGIEPRVDSFLTQDEQLDEKIRELIPALVLVEGHRSSPSIIADPTVDSGNDSRSSNLQTGVVPGNQIGDFDITAWPEGVLG